MPVRVSFARLFSPETVFPPSVATERPYMALQLRAHPLDLLLHVHQERVRGDHHTSAAESGDLWAIHSIPSGAPLEHVMSFEAGAYHHAAGLAVALRDGQIWPAP